MDNPACSLETPYVREEAGEMAQWLGSLAAPAEVLQILQRSWVQFPAPWQYMTILNSTFKGPDTLLKGFHAHSGTHVVHKHTPRHTCSAQTYTQARHSYTFEKLFRRSFTRNLHAGPRNNWRDRVVGRTETERLSQA